MTDPVTPLSPDDAALAAELALSLLEGDVLERAKTRLVQDPSFAAEVRRCQNQFAQIAENEVAPVAPPVNLRKSILRRVGSGGNSAIENWVRTTIGGLVGLVIAAGLAFFVLNSGLLDPQTDFDATAVLSAEDRRLRIEAGLNADAGEIVLARTLGVAAREGRATELWVIAEGAPPVSLGLVPNESRWQVSIPPLLRNVPLSLAISDEPEGGSPTGSPTGDIIAIAEFVSI